MMRLMAQGQPGGRGRRPCGAGWGGRWLVALVVGLGVSGGAVAQGLPKDILADKYRVLADRALAEQKPLKALAALEQYEGVAPERNWEFLYIYGALLVRFGETAAEVKKGHDLLEEQVMSRREGEEYEEAFELMDEAEEKLKAFKQVAADRLKAERARAEAERQRQARLHQFRDRLKMVSIPGGRFRMGCTREQRDCDDDENPVHEVQVGAFEIGQHEVTQEVWEAVMGENPSRHKCAQCPVEQVSWDDIQVFLKKLNEQTGSQYRLPTEAEWEYAARGGQQSRGYQYAGSNNADAVAWYRGNRGPPRRVGQKEPNELGLYDMSGNVEEWVEDCWHESYRGAPSDGRAWGSENSGDCSRRVLRGGSWLDFPRDLRAADRSRNATGLRKPLIGFRLARTLTP